MFDWSLPGPAKFLERVGEHARTTGIAAVLAPPHLPEGLDDALRRALAGTHHDQKTIEAVPGRAPLDLLSEALAKPLTSAKHLRHDREVMGLAVVVRMTADSDLARWDTLLRAYVSSCSSRGQRWDFVVVVVAPPSWEAALVAAKIKTFPWRGVITRLDAVRAALSAIENGRSPLQDRLAAETAIALGGWDLAWVVEETRRRAANLETLLRIPQPVNQGVSNHIAPTWATGNCDVFDERVFIHPSFADAADLRRRIWEAQVSVLFGILEQERVKFVEEHRRFLQRLVAHPQDCEWGELAHLLRSEGRLSSDVEPYRRARNSLAHGEPLKIEIFTSAFQRASPNQLQERAGGRI